MVKIIRMDNSYYSQGLPLDYATPPINYPDEKKGISLVKELSPQDHLREMMQWLEGKVWDDKKKIYVKITDSVKPLMNEEGRNMFFHQATSIISPIVTMSNYTKDYRMIHALTLMLVKRATIHFHLHWRDYDIKRKTQIAMIGDKLMILGLSAFYKALGAGDRKAATSNIHESISTLMRPEGADFLPNKQRSTLARLMRR